MGIINYEIKRVKCNPVNTTTVQAGENHNDINYNNVFVSAGLSLLLLLPALRIFRGHQSY